MTGIAGCGNQTEENRTKAEQLLREKYQEEFTVVSYQGKDWDKSWFQAEAIADAYPDMVFALSVDDKDGLSDTYVQHRVAAKVADVFAHHLKGLDGGYYLYTVATTANTATSDADISIEQFDHENPINEYMVYLFIDKEQYESGKVYDALGATVRNHDEWSGYIAVIPVESKTLTGIQNFAETNDTMVNGYEAEDESVDIRYENGTMLPVKEDFEKRIGEIK